MKEVVKGAVKVVVQEKVLLEEVMLDVQDKQRLKIVDNKLLNHKCLNYIIFILILSTNNLILIFNLWLNCMQKDSFW